MTISPRLKPILTAAVLSVMACGCTPVVKYQGYVALEEQPSTAKVGEDTINSVRSKFGSPTQISTFETNTWYYMTQTTDQFGAYRPRLRGRLVTAIKFDKESQKVAEVKTYTAADGRVIAYNDRETATSGRELGILQQLLGTLGTTMLPQQDADPGDLPGTIGRR